jgi:hypothetical protein
MSAVDKSLVYHGRQKKGKCVLGQQKFSCSYDDTGEEVDTE